MKKARILNKSKKRLLQLIAAINLILVEITVHAVTLPVPPTIDGTAPTVIDPLGYMTNALKYFILLGLLILAVFAVLSFSGGVISELNEARKRGEWGKFGAYIGAGILVIVIVLFGAWWGSDIISNAI